LRDFKRAARQIIKPDRNKTYNNYLKSLEIKIKTQDIEVAKARETSERKRIEVTEALKDRKALERLKEKSLEDFKKEENLAEQKTTDEIVSYKYNKTKKAEFN
jgi:flagellar FliJ protein